MKTYPCRSRFRQVAVQLSATALAALLVNSAMRGQVSVVAPTPAAGVDPTDRTALTSSGGAVDDLRLRPIVPLDEVPLAAGPFQFRPHAYYRFLYADGLQVARGKQVDSVIQDVAPGLFVSFGEHWTVDYTPAWKIYSNGAFRDTLDHSALVTFQTRYEDLTLNFSQSYDASSDPLIETGAQTATQVYHTYLSGTYSLTDTWASESTFDQTVRFADNFPTDRDWSGTERLIYRVAPNVNVSGSVQLGYVSVIPGPDISYTRGQGEVSWRAGPGVRFKAHLGEEERRIHSHFSKRFDQPVYGASLEYTPSPRTRFVAAVDRGFAVSYAADDITEATRLTASLDQRVADNWDLTVGGEYDDTRFRNAVVPALDRKDRTSSANLRLSTLILHHVTVAAVYQYIHNDSDTPGFSFKSDQIGLEIGYRY